MITAALSTPIRAALALGCEVVEISDQMASVLAPENGIAPQVVENAGWKQNLLTDFDLANLPIPTHALPNGGAFITGGVTICKDSVSGRSNLSYNRMQVLGPRILGFTVNEWRHVMEFYKVQQEKDEPLSTSGSIRRS